MISEIQEKILKGTIQVFNKKGLKLTMDDVADELKISKKTIYKEFNDKDELFFATIDYGFAAVKKKEAEILSDDSLDLVDKIVIGRRIIDAMTGTWVDMDEPGVAHGIGGVGYFGWLRPFLRFLYGTSRGRRD